MITSALTMELKGLLFLSSILLLNHTYYAQDCCQKKIVSGPAEYVGSYTFVKKFVGAKDDNCADSCIYRKDTGPAEDQYCFKAVNTGAATIDDHCDGPTSSSSTLTPTVGSTLDPVSQINTSKKKIEDANTEIVEENNKSEAASSASSAVDSIASALEGSATTTAISGRVKRQSESFIAPLAVVSTCLQFDENFRTLLDNLKELDDDKIPLINELVGVLSVHLPNVAICNAAEKAAIKAETASDVQTAKNKTDEYREKKEVKIKSLVELVEEEILLIESSNQILVNFGSTTIPPPTIPHVATQYTNERPSVTTPGPAPTTRAPATDDPTPVTPTTGAKASCTPTAAAPTTATTTNVATTFV